MLRRRAAALALALAAADGWAQYPGQAGKQDEQPAMRSIAVLEYTGDFDAPKACRLIPVLLVAGDQLFDASTYMARPQPLAVSGEVEYEVERNGRIAALFDIEGAAQQQGLWVGHGRWKKPPEPKAKPDPMAEMAKLDVVDENGDRPVLHRKHPKPGTDAGPNGGGEAKKPAPASDPDRPTIHRKDSGTDAGEPAPETNPDPDRPTIHRKAESPTAADDPDRPTIKKSKKKVEDAPRTDALAGVTDPDRPRLKRGKSEQSAAETSSLEGMPAEFAQAVAVSDARDRKEHEWSYHWATPEDEQKMKAALEDQARLALGLVPPPAPMAPAAKKAAAGKKARTAPPPPAPAAEPAPLEDEQFRVFELAYGAGATMVLSARTAGAADQRKFVTLVAQPDLYGNLLVLLKHTTDAAHLDAQPRMRLVDAVDALADNRGELLFELRGSTQRQFTLYRVLRGRAEELFTGAQGDFVHTAE